MRLFAFAVLAVFALGAHAQEPDSTPGGNADEGRRLFADIGCYQCHGYEAHAGPGGRLAPDPIPFAAFSRYVRQPSGQMPPYTPNVLAEGELADIYAFLESIPDPPSPESLPELDD